MGDPTGSGMRRSTPFRLRPIDPACSAPARAVTGQAAGVGEGGADQGPAGVGDVRGVRASSCHGRALLWCCPRRLHEHAPGVSGAGLPQTGAGGVLRVKRAEASPNREVHLPAILAFRAYDVAGISAVWRNTKVKRPVTVRERTSHASTHAFTQRVRTTSATARREPVRLRLPAGPDRITSAYAQVISPAECRSDPAPAGDPSGSVDDGDRLPGVGAVRAPGHRINVSPAPTKRSRVIMHTLPG